VWGLIFIFIEKNRLVPWVVKVYLAMRRNLLGEPNNQNVCYQGRYCEFANKLGKR